MEVSLTRGNKTSDTKTTVILTFLTKLIRFLDLS